jgi:hypothetical protein
MSAITKQALLVDNNQSFPNNNSGQITAADLRAFNVNVIDSTVNQTEYTTNSGSWNVSISNINAFTASQQPSFTALNSFTASQLTINSGVNSFTQSATGRLNNLESTTSSLNAWSSSVGQILEEGVSLGYSTRYNYRGALISASVTPNVLGLITNIDVISDSTKTNTSSFNAFTASTNQKIDSLEVFSSSAKISIAAFGAFTASYGPVATGSLVATASYSGTTISYTKGDGSTFTNVGIQNTASFNAYTSSQLASFNAYTSSQLTINAGYNTYTSSNNTKWNTLGNLTGSYLITASVSASTITFTKQDTSTFNIAVSAGFPFTGSAQITGSLGVTGSISLTNGGFSGSLVNNITDTYSSTAKVNSIITLTQSEYNTISASANGNTLYIII